MSSVAKIQSAAKATGFRAVAPAATLIHVIREGRASIGPDLAAWILKDAAFDGQRKSETHHVELLTHLMRQGRWSAGSQLAFCELGGRLYLTNGKHRMNAVVASGIPQEFQVLITRCGSMREVESDYHRHDTAARKRSVAEIMHSTELGRESTLPYRITRTLYSLAPIMDRLMVAPNYRNDPLSRDVDSHLEAVGGWMQEAKIFACMTEKARLQVKNAMTGSGVLGVALMTIRHQPKVSAEFWPRIAEDDGLRKGDPRKALLDALVAGDYAKDTGSMRFMPAALAWNAFFESRQLKIIKPAAYISLRIAGTPVNVPATVKVERSK